MLTSALLDRGAGCCLFFVQRIAWPTQHRNQLGSGRRVRRDHGHRSQQYCNQVNNVPGFHHLRGALDCRATTINDEMKLAASPRAGEPGQGRRAGLRAARVRQRAHVVRPRVPDPRAVRLPGAAQRPGGRGARGGGDRRGADADRRLRRLPPAPGGHARTLARAHARAAGGVCLLRQHLLMNNHLVRSHVSIQYHKLPKLMYCNLYMSFII